MDIMELGAIGELVGGVAVIGSLLYLALQVRHGNSLVQATASTEYMQRVFDITGLFVRDRKLAEVWATAGTNFDELDEVDQQRLLFFEWRAIESWNLAFTQRKSGVLGDSEWKRVTGTIEVVGSRQAIHEAWKVFQHLYDDDFRNFMKSSLDGALQNSAR